MDRTPVRVFIITVVRSIARLWSILNVALFVAFAIREGLSPQGSASTPVE